MDANMKFTYEYYFSSIPRIVKKDEKSEAEASHCHSKEIDFYYSNLKSYKPSDRKYIRNKIDTQINKIQVCIAFFKEYKDSVTSPEEKAAITAAIKCDELEIETLLKDRPSCVIL